MPEPTAVYPAALQPAAVPVQPAPAPAPTRPADPSVDPGRFWAGVVATALVAALVGLVGVVIIDQILNIELAVQDIFGTDSTGAAYVIGAAVLAVLAGGLLHLLVLTTPKPKAFFGWIMFLGTLTAALLPLTWTDELESAISAGIVNALIGIAIWSLLVGVLSRTLRPGTPID
ncbi:hypothetical protein ASG23_07370 [Cellulomonas sp. Leaf395]|nr:hypothetical protein ASG23_07370 [Cellulomonas sp. Leaf395]